MILFICYYYFDHNYFHFHFQKSPYHYYFISTFLSFFVTFTYFSPFISFEQTINSTIINVSIALQPEPNTTSIYLLVVHVLECITIDCPSGPQWFLSTSIRFMSRLKRGPLRFIIYCGVTMITNYPGTSPTLRV